MKLKQILTEQIDHRYVTTHKQGRKMHSKPDEFEYDDGGNIIGGQDKERLGKGSFSVVYPDKKDPHMVKKLGRAVGNKGNIIAKGKRKNVSDRFIEYAKWIVDNKLWEKSINFPRIYVSEYDEANNIHDFQMERLQEYGALSAEALFGLIKRYFDKGEIRKWLTEYEVDLDDKYDLQLMLTSFLNITFKQKRLHHIRDDELLKAMELISSKVDDRGGYWRYDIHEDNVMYRLTSSGPHLVLSDIIFGVN